MMEWQQQRQSQTRAPSPAPSSQAPAPVSAAQNVAAKDRSGDHEARIREIAEDMEKATVRERPAAAPPSEAAVSVGRRIEEDRSTSQADAPQNGVNKKKTDLWMYQDSQGRVHGPYSGSKMAAWFLAGNLMISLPIKRACDTEFQTLGEVIKARGRVPFQCDGSELGDGPSLPPMLPVPLLQQNAQVANVASSKQLPSTRSLMPDQPQLPSFCQGKTKTSDTRGDLGERRVSAVPDPAMTTPVFQPIRPAPLGVCNLSAANGDNGSRKTTVLGIDQEPLEEAYGGYPIVQQPPQPHAATLKGAYGGYPVVQQPPQPRAATLEVAYGGYPIVQQPPQPRAATLEVSYGGFPIVQPPPQPRAATLKGWNWNRQESLGACAAWSEPGPPAMSEHMSSSAAVSKRPWQGKTVSEPPLLLERRRAADREFTRWTLEALKTMPSYVHAPTFLELLKEVDSPKEIEGYILMQLGDGDNVKKFAQEFIRQRAVWKNLTGWKSSATTFGDL